MRAASPLLNLKLFSAAETSRSPTKPPNKQVPAPSPGAGFVLMDALLSPISFNGEAAQILNYPDKPSNGSRPDIVIGGKIRARLMRQQPLRESPFVTEFQSGRRRYLCRVFLVDSHAKGPCHPSIAVLLVRPSSGLIPVMQVSQQFNLTRREREVLEYLLPGLSNKEIASRMNVSPNTIKVFVRLIMVKMGVCSRSAIIGKIMMVKTDK